MKAGAARLLWLASLTAGSLAACGLDGAGLGDLADAGGDALASIDSATDAAGTDATVHEGGSHDGSAPDARADAQHPDGGRDAGADAPRDAPTPLDTSGPCQGTSTSCGTPGHCVDCTTGAQGSACLGGTTCGCTQANGSDCPSNLACDTGSMTCTTACAPGSPCHGGCCNAGTCSPGTDNGSCGGDGKGCKVCGGAQPTCSAGTCTGACGGATDGTCGMNTCCGNGGTCQGIGPAACGSPGGTCVDCANAPGGSKCVSGACGCMGNGDCSNSPSGAICLLTGGCGCNLPVDCPVDQECDPIAHTCSASCPIASTCNGGCCAAGSCVPGTADNACGKTGLGCVDCTLQSKTCNNGNNCN